MNNQNQKLTPVTSSFIKAIGHNANNVLTVLFANQSVKNFARVSKKKFNAFLNADSKGTFFNFSIKPAHREVD